MFSKYSGLLLLMLALAGCNTVQGMGMGMDIERGGEATQDAAKDVQQKM